MTIEYSHLDSHLLAILQAPDTSDTSEIVRCLHFILYLLRLGALLYKHRMRNQGMQTEK
jgi:hypothetical protein